MSTTTDKKIVIASLAVVLTIFSLSYILFLKYQPKILKQIEEVKGLRTNSMLDIPFPSDSEKLGYSQTPTSKNTTFQTLKTPQEILTFYKNILENKKWELDTLVEKDNFVKFKYKTKEKNIEIIAMKENSMGYSIVSIEINDK